MLNFGWLDLIFGRFYVEFLLVGCSILDVLTFYFGCMDVEVWLHGCWIWFAGF